MNREFYSLKILNVSLSKIKDPDLFDCIVDLTSYRKHKAKISYTEIFFNPKMFVFKTFNLFLWLMFCFIILFFYILISGLIFGWDSKLDMDFVKYTLPIALAISAVLNLVIGNYRRSKFGIIHKKVVEYREPGSYYFCCNPSFFEKEILSKILTKATTATISGDTSNIGNYFID